MSWLSPSIRDLIGEKNDDDEEPPVREPARPTRPRLDLRMPQTILATGWIRISTVSQKKRIEGKERRTKHASLTTPLIWIA